MIIVSIEGLPGCHKNDIIKLLENKYNIHVYSNSNPNLHNSFRENPKHNTFVYEIDRLTTINQQVSNIISDSNNNNSTFNNSTSNNSISTSSNSSTNSGEIYEKTETETETTFENIFFFNTLHAYREVYLHHLQHKGYLNQVEFDLCLKLHNALYRPPDVIIYLYGNLSSCYDRYKNEKDISSDNSYSFDEYQSLQYQYEWVFDVTNCKIPLFKVNIDDDLDMIVKNIEVILTKISNR